MTVFASNYFLVTANIAIVSFLLNLITWSTTDLIISVNTSRIRFQPMERKSKLTQTKTEGGNFFVYFHFYDVNLKKEMWIKKRFTSIDFVKKKKNRIKFNETK